jgi:hypothetical protein
MVVGEAIVLQGVGCVVYLHEVLFAGIVGGVGRADVHTGRRLDLAGVGSVTDPGRGNHGVDRSTHGVWG